MSPMRQRTVVPAGFFALRTPLLPFETLVQWGAGDRAAIRARLIELVERPPVREAIFLASPVLDENLEQWRREPESERGQKVERSLVRYLARMAGRATPFGLFAGCSIGRIGAQTNLALAEAARYRRHTRLDMYFVCALVEALVRLPEVRATLEFRPNTSLCRVAGQLRLAEARMVAGTRAYHLVAVEPTSYLDATLERANTGALPGALAEALCSDDSDITAGEARQFIDELIDAQLLVPMRFPAVTGPEPLPALVAALRPHPIAVQLDEMTEQLHRLDETLGQAPERYRQLARTLGELPIEVELSRLFQVDLVKPAAATIGPQVMEELQRAIERLQRCVVADDPFLQFRSAFAERYGDREAALCEVLDEENGIGFETIAGPTAEVSPLFEGLQFPSGDEDTLLFGAREHQLLALLEQAWRSGAHEILLTERDWAALVTPAPPPLPDSWAALATLVARSSEAVDRGEFRLFLESAAGPSGVSLLGRFCHADAELAAEVREQLRREEALRPDAIFAEIVHLPEGRIGNILARPLLRDDEVVYLGVSGAPPERQIAVTDLMISVSDGRVVLRSQRLGREVVPRLTNAHNYAARSLAIYRFLCALQRQGIASVVGWSWGPLASARFLPRVVSGKIVLSLARWNLEVAALEPLRQGDREAQFAAVQALRRARAFPRWIAVADGDHLLPIDLDNPLSVDSFVHLVRRRTGVQLSELYPPPDELCAHGPEGHFVHELVIPFLRKPAPDTDADTDADTVADTVSDTVSVSNSDSVSDTDSDSVSVSVSDTHTVFVPFVRTFPPGSEWLYAKLYTGTATADRLLSHLIAPLIAEALSRGAISRWFFLRFGDPEWHLRLRLQGPPARLWGEVLPALERAAAPLLADGQLWRLQLDTYERESQRYGGDEGIELAEAIFDADSQAVLALLPTITGEAGADRRWRLTLVGLDRLLDDLGLPLAEKLNLVKRLRAAFGIEFRVYGGFERQLGDKYRAQRHALEELLAKAPPKPFEVRSQSVRNLGERLRAMHLVRPLHEIAESLLHMHANRMLRSSARAHELVLYDFLERLYTGRIARRSAT